LLEVITIQQLADWGRYLALEPVGFIGEDARHAELCALIARVAGNPDARPEQFSRALEAAPPSPSDGKAFVKHVKAVLAKVKPKERKSAASFMPMRQPPGRSTAGKKL